jgi:hypothetical protein
VSNGLVVLDLNDMVDWKSSISKGSARSLRGVHSESSSHDDAETDELNVDSKDPKREGNESVRSSKDDMIIEASIVAMVLRAMNLRKLVEG